MPQYTVSTVIFGAIVTQPLVARPGYYSRFRMYIAGKGGVNGTHTVAIKADAPYNLFAQLVFKDAFGTPIFVGPGYTILYLVPFLSGGFGTVKNARITQLPSFSAVSVGTAGTGNFKFATCLPLEFTKALGVIAGANAYPPPIPDDEPQQLGGLLLDGAGHRPQVHHPDRLGLLLAPRGCDNRAAGARHHPPVARAAGQPHHRVSRHRPGAVPPPRWLPHNPGARAPQQDRRAV